MSNAPLDPRAWPIRIKLMLGIVIAALLPLSVLTLTDANARRDELEQAVSAQFSQRATLEKERLAEVLGAQLMLLQSIALESAIIDEVMVANAASQALGAEASARELREVEAAWGKTANSSPPIQYILDRNANAASSQLARHQSLFPDHVELFITDRRGAVIAATGRTSDYDQSDELWWQQAYQKGRGGFYLGQPSFDQSTGFSALNMAVPITERGNATIIGVLRSTYRIDAIQRLVSRGRFEHTGHLTLLDGERKVVSSSDQLSHASRPPRSWSRILATPSSSGLAGLLSSEDQPLVAGIARLDAAGGDKRGRAIAKLDWLLVVHQRQSEAFVSVQQSVRRSLKVALIFGILAIVLAIFVARYSLAPIVSLASVSRRMAAGDLGARMAVTHRDELGELGRTFNAMADEVASVVENLEERVAARTEQLQTAKTAAEAATRAKSAFLASMSHELRTPLNAIIGFSEILHDGAFGTLNVKQTKYVSNVLTSGRHLLQLVNDILDIAKVEAGKMSLEPTATQLPPIIATSLLMVKEKARDEGIELRSSVSESLQNMSVWLDERKLKQVLFNLLSNAVKFTPGGGRVEVGVTTLSGVALEETIRTRGLRREGALEQQVWLRFAVNDTGTGIEPENQERVFAEFEQIGATFAGGTGLGLSLCRRLVELQGGRIWAESAGLAHGSTFVFVLPLRQPPSPSNAARTALRAAGCSDASPAKPISSSERVQLPAPEGPLVLVVDDDPQANELVSVYLTEAGFRVLRAFDGIEALQLTGQHRPDAITLDISLPGKDGWEVLAELKSTPALRTIPVIIVSIIDRKPFGLNLGASAHFVKPVSRNELLDAVRGAIGDLGGHRATVLVTDDDTATLEVLVGHLSSAGYGTLQAHGGRECIDLTLAEHPDIIILDLLMPEVTGFDVVQELQRHPGARDIPIIILTAKDLSEEERERLSRHVRHIATKDGSEREELVAAVKRHLHSTPFSSSGKGPAASG